MQPKNKPNVKCTKATVFTGTGEIVFDTATDPLLEITTVINPNIGLFLQIKYKDKAGWSRAFFGCAMDVVEESSDIIPANGGIIKP